MAGPTIISWGGEVNDLINGGLGDDTLLSGTWSDGDALIGGDGNDLHTIDQAGDQSVEFGAEGFDTLSLETMDLAIGNYNDVEFYLLTFSTNVGIYGGFGGSAQK